LKPDESEPDGHDAEAIAKAAHENLGEPKADDEAMEAAAHLKPDGSPEGGDKAESARHDGKPDAADEDPHDPADPRQAAPTREQAMAKAARQVQESLQAQLQAAQQLPRASEQAAKALARASRNLEKTVPGPKSAKPAADATASAQKPGEANKPGAKGDASKQQANREGQGLGAPRDREIAMGDGKTDARPKSVQELGISASDWAKLGPLMQQDLLNAAQQTGPPAYREMIKNYYIRIAGMQSEGAE
jgi:hypothetical protein